MAFRVDTTTQTVRLVEKLERIDSWQCEHLSSFITKPILSELESRFYILETNSKIKLLFSFLGLRKGLVKEFKESLDLILQKASQDEEEWVRVTAQMISDALENRTPFVSPNSTPSPSSLEDEQLHETFEKTVSLIVDKLNENQGEGISLETKQELNMGQIFPIEWSWINSELLSLSTTNPEENFHFRLQNRLTLTDVTPPLPPRGISSGGEDKGSHKRDEVKEDGEKDNHNDIDSNESESGGMSGLRGSLNRGTLSRSWAGRSIENMGGLGAERRGLQRKNKMQFIEINEVREIERESLLKKKKPNPPPSSNPSNGAQIVPPGLAMDGSMLNTAMGVETEPIEDEKSRKKREKEELSKLKKWEREEKKRKKLEEREEKKRIQQEEKEARRLSKKRKTKGHEDPSRLEESAESDDYDQKKSIHSSLPSLLSSNPQNSLGMHGNPNLSPGDLQYSSLSHNPHALDLASLSEAAYVADAQHSSSLNTNAQSNIGPSHLLSSNELHPNNELNSRPIGYPQSDSRDLSSLLHQSLLPQNQSHQQMSSQWGGSHNQSPYQQYSQQPQQQQQQNPSVGQSHSNVQPNNQSTSNNPGPPSSAGTGGSRVSLGTLFEASNQLTPENKEILVHFLSGNRMNPTPEQGPVKQILLNEEQKWNPSTNTSYLEQIIFEMNYSNGSWRKLRRKKTIAQTPQNNPNTNNSMNGDQNNAHGSLNIQSYL